LVEKETKLRDQSAAAGDLVWQLAEVVEDDQGSRWARFSSLTACERCLAGEGCGAGVFSRLFSRHQARLPLPPDSRLRPGQRIRVGISTSELLLMAFLLYGLPLIGFFIGAAVFHVMFPDHAWRDLAALLGGLLAGALSFLPARQGWGVARNPRIEALSC